MAITIEDDIIDRLPEPVPSKPITIEDETHTFRKRTSQGGTTVPKTVYTLSKADVIEVRSIRGTVDGREYEFERGTEWETRDITGTGEPDSIAFIDSNVRPDVETDFYVTYVALPIIRRFTDSYSNDVSVTSDTIDETIESKQVDNATGRSLDELAAIYGEAAVRGGLIDERYRPVVKSIVPALSANGTIPGIKQAISVATGVDVEDVVIEEDFEKTGYIVKITQIGARNISSSALNGIVERADPSGVELLQTPLITFDDAILVSEASVSVSSTDPSGTGKLGSGNIGSDTIGG